MKRYEAYRNGLKGSKSTYFDTGTVAERNTGLTISTMTASVLSGNAVSVNSQAYSSGSSQLAYQINFANAGKAVVRVKTTFTGSEEIIIKDYHYTTIDNRTSVSDYT